MIGMDAGIRMQQMCGWGCVACVCKTVPDSTSCKWWAHPSWLFNSDHDLARQTTRLHSHFSKMVHMVIWIVEAGACTRRTPLPGAYALRGGP